MSFVTRFTSEKEREEYKKHLLRRIERSRRAMRVVQRAVRTYGEEGAEAFYTNLEEDWFSPDNTTSSEESREVVVTAVAASR